MIGLTLKLPNSSHTLQEEVALMQHHVVVTGFERKHVTEDYLRRVSKGRETCKVRDYYLDLCVDPPR